MNDDIAYQIKSPDASLAPYVESYWLLHNRAATSKEVVILPDGRIDLFFSVTEGQGFTATLLGIGTQPEQASIPPGRLTFAISFKPLAAEYVLHTPVSHLVNSATRQPAGFWGFEATDMQNFDVFCEKAARQIQAALEGDIDNRKQQLFELIFASNGAITVKELSDRVYWSSRQINRYFQQYLGLPLKVYCNILRFRASFKGIKEGKLFPGENFADQSHFIKEVKKLAGVLPKELKQNPNDRFIQFSTLGRR
ncbi:AraC family transcriptional regulator [Chitinophaga horti]|uniref:AraC family transcriptional regulator n=1 Tax=Chitinophaga horti TaxID=2920382 RepID=A0ABY6J847_9BACT|nr:AraC family transcriptional regulator [Chitinophaga horti]UYQ95868.1 AraC family transcriptional regulator [Chitinophaga horti]